MPIQKFDRTDPDLPAAEAWADPEPTDYLLYALGAIRRRKGVALGVFLACISAVAAYYASSTPMYRAETRILAQRQQALPSLVRAGGPEDQPTRGAWEMIHRRDNLVELVKIAGLLEPSSKTEPASPVRRATRWFTGAMRSNDDPLETLVLLLDKRLKVDAAEVTIGIEIDWPNPQQAYRIVEGALQNFLEARHVQEVTALDETIAVLRGRAAALRGELERVTEEARLVAVQDAARSSRPQPRGGPGSAQQSQASEEMARLRSMLDAKQRAIADVEDLRRRRLAELMAQYDSRRSVLTENHPEMVNLRQDIAALNRDSLQITELRAEERRLRNEYHARSGREPASLAAAAPSTEVVLRPANEGINAAIDRNDRVVDARRRYQEVMDSVNRAQAELDAARSAFELRYKVIWPVQVPKKRVSPNPVKILGIGGLASLLLALLLPVLLDWRSGKVLERWQIERGLKLPIVGEIHCGR